MTLKRIEIKNIKGISHKTFDLDIIPNRPSLLVAPNGFGKSSFTCAFNSLNSRRIKLDEENFFEKTTTNLPSLKIVYEKVDGEIIELVATDNSNTLSEEFDCFVIKNPIKAKGSSSYYGGGATAEILIETIELIKNVPNTANFDNYSVTEFRTRFGENSAILVNALTKNIFSNERLLKRIVESFTILDRANSKTFNQKLDKIIKDINSFSGTKKELIEWITNSKLTELKDISNYNSIWSIINELELELENEIEEYFIAVQIVWLFHKDRDKFKNACNYNLYKLEKEKFDGILSNFNTTWKKIKTTQTEGNLVVSFPKANEISNGQRDILTFISMLFKAKRVLKKKSNILIIDEVFDYLDDANLVTAQYYITKIIDEYKSDGKRLYPIILTHLNPLYFKNFAFSKQKTYYLDKSNIELNDNMRRLVVKRNDVKIKDEVSNKLFHYNPNKIDNKNEFIELGLPQSWGEETNFYDYINLEIEKYLLNESYDPFAVCCALRVKIEKNVFEKLEDSYKEKFLSTHKTRNKLEYADEVGVSSPESYYLLGIIYNEGMHWKEGVDNISPIASKLENLIIKKLIKDVFS
jgi:hypothetical protein